MNIFRLFESKKNMKICSKTHHSNFFWGGGRMHRIPLANAWLRHASQAPKKVGHLWQILHTPMDYY